MDLDHQNSEYPPLEPYGADYSSTNNPVRALNTLARYAGPGNQPERALASSSNLSPSAQYYNTATDYTDIGTSEDEDQLLVSRLALGGDTSDSAVGGRSKGHGEANRPGRGRPRGRGRGGRKGKLGKRARAPIDPGQEFNTLHKEATEAFVGQQDYEKALGLILRAIEINAEIYSAHALLSDIHFATGDNDKALQSLFIGAHTAPNDAEVWRHVADTFFRFQILDTAAYCFQRLLHIDPQDHDARFDKALVSQELGHHTKALKDFDYLLRKMPHNSDILRHIAAVCLDVNDTGRAIGYYDDALEYRKLNSVVDDYAWKDLIIHVDLIKRLHGAHKAIRELKNIARWIVGRADEAIWEDYGGDDREWDADDVPRRIEVPEFQAGRYPVEAYGAALWLELRIKLGEYRLKTDDRQEALNHFEWLVPEDRGEGAPLYDYMDLFLQAADALCEIKDYTEALRYYEALYSIEAYDHLDFWLGIGACSYACEKRDQALHCYEKAMELDPMSSEARTNLSKLYTFKGDREKAITLARSAIKLFDNGLSHPDKRQYIRRPEREGRKAAWNAWREACKLPKSGKEGEVLGKHRNAKSIRGRRRLSAREAVVADTGEELTDAQMLEGRTASLTPPHRQSLLDQEDVSRKSKTKRKERTATERHENIQQCYSTLCRVSESMRQGDDIARNTWIECAETLVAEFRTEKALYPPERYVKFRGFDRPSKKPGQLFTEEDRLHGDEDMPMPSIEVDVPDKYCGIKFTKWLDVFLEYSLLLANLEDDSTNCYAVINASLDCNVWYHDPEAAFQIHACWLTCALALRDELTLFNTVIRWFMREFEFCTDMYRLFGALAFYFPYPHDKGGKSGQVTNAIFRSSPNQKFLFRQIMAIDSQLPVDYGIDQPDGPVPDFMRKAPTEVVYGSDKVQYQRKQAQQQDQSQRQSEEIDDEGDPHLSALSALTGEAAATSQRTYSPKELDTVLLTLYGQMLYAGGSFPNALSYFYRAYNIDPKNAHLCFKISLCYMHQMLKRQVEDRHACLLQAWSFFEQYADARVQWAEKQQNNGWRGLVAIVKREIEFNRARCYQMLGMNDLATRSYGKVLDMRVVKHEDEMDVDGGGNQYKEIYSMEAAYAMAGTYTTNGDFDTAREITEKYLVVE